MKLNRMCVHGCTTNEECVMCAATPHLVLECHPASGVGHWHKLVGKFWTCCRDGRRYRRNPKNDRFKISNS